MSIPYPFEISLKDWIGCLTMAAPNLSVPVYPETEDDWDEWALALIRLNQLGYIAYPDKTYFKGDQGWERWARFFVQSYDPN